MVKDFIKFFPYCVFVFLYIKRKNSRNIAQSLYTAADYSFF